MFMIIKHILVADNTDIKQILFKPVYNKKLFTIRHQII